MPVMLIYYRQHFRSNTQKSNSAIIRKIFYNEIELSALKTKKQKPSPHHP